MKKKFFSLKMNLFRPESIRFYNRLCREDQLSQTDRANLIFQRQKALVSYAYEYSPFYRERYSRYGFSPEDLKSPSDFERLPVLTKDDLRNYGKSIICDGVKISSLRRSTTGGSTGEPVTVYHDKNIPIDAVSWWLLQKWGLDISDNVGYIFRYAPKRRWLNSLIWYPTRRVFMDASYIDDTACNVFYRECLASGIKCICGYVGAVYQFAQFLGKNKLPLPEVKAIWTTSAPLPEPLRQDMEAIFGCPVFSQYGCCETFWLAAECPELHGLHQFDTIRHLEVTGEDHMCLPNGTYGEVLISDLLNYKFPLIRYKNGDKACKLTQKCTCGSGFPLLAPVRGRVTEMMLAPDGTRIAGDFMTTIFDADPEAVRAFYVVQKKDYSLLIRYIPRAQDASARVNDVCRQLSERFAENGIRVYSEAVAEIPHDRGKTRFIVSEL